MEYALYNGLRTAAQPTLKAVCAHCGGEVIAKCGSKKIWHWAHTSTESCDSWYEPETAWHRQWKQVFGEVYSEIRVLKDEGYHIADVLNKEGIVFEFQNSSIGADMIAAREDFYGAKMIWLINGEAFKNHFRMYDDAFMTDWNLKLLNEFEAAEHYRRFTPGLILEDWQVKQEPLKALLKQLDFMYVAEARIYHRPMPGNRKAFEDQLLQETQLLYERHKSFPSGGKGTFTWAHPRRSWEDAKRTVFIDFGGEDLYWVREGMGKASGKGMRIGKKEFIEKYAG